MGDPPSPPRVRPSYPVQVAEAALVTPHMRRVTFTGDALASLQSPLPAQWMKVVLTPPGAVSRTGRAYTIRALDSARKRLVMDFVLHGDTGPLSTWAAQAQVGDFVSVGAPRGGFRQIPEAPWRVLVGDETALPAIVSILGTLPRSDVQTTVIVELPDEADAQSLQLAPRDELRWLPRGSAPYGEQLVHTVARLTLPPGPGQVFLAGEAGAVSRMKLDVVRRTPEAVLDAKGYWKVGASDHRD